MSLTRDADWSPGVIVSHGARDGEGNGAYLSVGGHEDHHGAQIGKACCRAELHGLFLSRNAPGDLQ